MKTAFFETNAAVQFVSMPSVTMPRQSELTAIGDILTSPAFAKVLHDSICEVCCDDAPCISSEGRAYCLPCLEVAVTASQAESLLTPASPAYDVLTAFDLALTVCENERRLLTCWAERFPALADDLAAVTACRVCYGWTLSELHEEAYPNDPPLAALALNALTRAAAAYA